MRKIDVLIGEVKSGNNNVTLETSAIGSCIAVMACDPQKKNGAMAHIMLPGEAPADKKAAEKTKYAANAIEEIIGQMAQLGSSSEDIKAVLVGAGNVLEKEDDTICQDNIDSVLNILEKKGIEVAAKAVGGIKRRSVFFDVGQCVISYTEGEAARKILWRAP